MNKAISRYIFLTTEGITFQPNSKSLEPDIENLQVIGYGDGNTPEEAFEDLIKKNNYLLETTFNEIFCRKVGEIEKYFFLDIYKTANEKEGE